MKQKIKGVRSDAVTLIISVMVFLGALVLGVVITSLLVYQEWIREEVSPYGLTITMLLASACGTMVTIRSMKEKRLIYCIILLLIYFVSMTVINVLIFGNGMVGVPATIGILTAGVAVALALSITPKKSGFGRKIKI